MIGTLRLSAAVLVAALATPPLMLWQFFAVRTGLVDEHAVPRLWHGLVLRLLGLRVQVFGTLAPDRPLMLASNHVSWTDIMVLSSLADVHFIAKSEVAGWPVIGTLSRLQRTVFVERQARGKSGEQVGEIAERMTSGDPMVLFAEGTTSDGNTILPFKSTLFAAAVRAMETADAADIAVQPVAIAYTRLHGMPMGRRHRRHLSWIGDQELLPHLTWLLREGAVDVEVHFGEPLRFGDGASRKEIARGAEERVREMMAAALHDPKRSK
ncbi:lysophospholipid acyltransferase family protein [Aquamicrobium sp. LC103]|uniref:lysophospholipid acyltransferase family protein n=1 Tax=Aquamicrobium sp. LC103 TaxID=1120658 RepID=UPI00063E74D7|nr:lysophospholipid acyltransferase family protein [Aquamicrobium sp. LC103]TKT74869.1 1-acyl-sn-glycerol-3-phosphate acyltransferase [Aquamicrobium sp. LC103]